MAGGFVVCSGTAGIDPATDGIEAQTEQALVNLAAGYDLLRRLPSPSVDRRSLSTRGLETRPSLTP